MSNIFGFADTWNNAGTAFDAIRVDVTDTGHAASSTLINLRIGGSTKFSVNDAGNIAAQNFTSTLQGLAPPSGGGTMNFLRADGSWATPVPAGASTSVNAQTGTSYTLQASDNGNVVTFNNAAAITVICPTGLGTGFSCLLVQLGAGQVGASAGGGATVNSYAGNTHLAGQYATGSVVAVTATSFVLAGQLA